tara:strand:- start:3668 stop:3982 length:315 start_codon:yes stop_codon:yes gene_type:complete
MTQTTLDFNKYPLKAGHQGGDTDRAAASSIEKRGRAKGLRDTILNKLTLFPTGSTPDEMAGIMGEDILSIRPRFTELKKQSLLVDTGIRRPSQNGKSQRVLRLA